MTQQRTDEQVVTKQDTRLEKSKYVHVISPPENVGIFAFLVRNGNPDPSSQDIVNEARDHGWWVTAICGATFIPTSDGANHDVCQICMDVAGMHMRNAGE